MVEEGLRSLSTVSDVMLRGGDGAGVDVFPDGLTTWEKEGEDGEDGGCVIGDSSWGGVVFLILKIRTEIRILLC